MKTITSLLVALAVTSGAASAQAPATTAPASAEPVDAKFMSADVDKSGFLDGKELDTFKAKLTTIDMDKDGKISPREYNIGVMTGVIAK